MDDNEYLEKLGKRIAELRKSKNWTQEEFAEISGLNRSALARMESGKINTTVNMLRRIAEHMGLELYQLVKLN